MSDFEVHSTSNDELARLRSELEAQTQVTAQQTHEMLRARLAESALRQQNERLRDELETAKGKYVAEYEIVDRVWAALGISDYESAGGKSISQIVAALKQQNERLREALQRIDTMIDRDGNFIDMHREELRGTARAALAADQSEEGKK